MSNSDLLKSMADVIRENEAQAAKKASEFPDPPKEEEKTNKKGGVPSSVKKPAVEDALLEELLLPAKVRLNPLFTPSMIKQIADYVTQGMFSHYHLYQCAFNSAIFEPSKRVLKSSCLLESPIPDNLNLSEATEMLVAGTAEMLHLMEKHLQTARVSMESALEANQQDLARKLDALAI